MSKWLAGPSYFHAHHPFTRSAKKIGRNEKCPCKSGKKYKKCHGANGDE